MPPDEWNCPPREGDARRPKPAHWKPWPVLDETLAERARFIRLCPSCPTTGILNGAEREFQRALSSLKPGPMHLRPMLGIGITFWQREPNRPRRLADEAPRQAGSVCRSYQYGASNGVPLTTPHPVTDQAIETGIGPTLDQGVLFFCRTARIMREWHMSQKNCIQSPLQNSEGVGSFRAICFRGGPALGRREYALSEEFPRPARRFIDWKDSAKQTFLSPRRLLRG